MSKCVSCPSKEEKPTLPCPASRTVLLSHFMWGGEGMLLSLCAKVRGASSSPYRPRNYKWGLIHSSHCCVLYFELSCQKSPLLSQPVPLRVTCGTSGTGGELQPTGIICTFVCGDELFRAMPAGPQLPQHRQTPD